MQLAPHEPPHGVPSGAFAKPHTPVVGSHAPTEHAAPAGHVVGFVPTHAPFWHESVCVHALLSLHVVPLAASGLLHLPVVLSHLPARWQPSCAVHVTAAPAHLPFVQTSVVVQRSPSSHDVPSVFEGFEHTPVVGSHVPAVWHVSSATHVTVAPLVHAPALHVSFVVQPLPSLHTLPSGFAGLLHVPVVGSHVPALWHWSCAVHVTLVPVHAPLLHASLVVHALPSSHDVPSAFGEYVHCPDVGSHVPPVWH
jgi:hypothetical protein